MSNYTQKIIGWETVGEEADLLLVGGVPHPPLITAPDLVWMKITAHSTMYHPTEFSYNVVHMEWLK